MRDRGSTPAPANLDPVGEIVLLRSEIVQLRRRLELLERRAEELMRRHSTHGATRASSADHTALDLRDPSG